MIIDLINTYHKDKCTLSDIEIREILINPFPEPVKVRVVKIGSADKPATLEDIADIQRQLAATATVKPVPKRKCPKLRGKVFKPLALYCTVGKEYETRNGSAGRKHVTFCCHSVFDGKVLEEGEEIILKKVECSENKACPAAVLKEVFGDKE